MSKLVFCGNKYDTQADIFKYLYFLFSLRKERNQHFEKQLTLKISKLLIFLQQLEMLREGCLYRDRSKMCNLRKTEKH